MGNLLELIKIILPAIVTGIVTYVVAKYNKFPNDKIEISYNRIYYPLIKLIKSSQNKNYERILKETKFRLQKYDKYASRTTMAACKLLEENIDSKNVKTFYNLLSDDIYKYNTRFRRRLGYPEPILISTLKYMSGYNKWLCVSYLSLLVLLVSLYIFSFLGTYVIVGEMTAFFAISSIGVLIISGCVILLYKVKYAITRIVNRIKK